MTPVSCWINLVIIHVGPKPKSQPPVTANVEFNNGPRQRGPFTVTPVLQATESKGIVDISARSALYCDDCTESVIRPKKTETSPSNCCSSCREDD